MRHLTTGECAKICQVSPATVSKWFDSGILKGFRIPQSRDRRIPENNLVELMLEYGMPVPTELQHLVVECTICASTFTIGQKHACIGKKK